MIAVVNNAAELAAAVGNADVDYIYLGDNIALTSGITIPPGKKSLVFDGTYGGVTHRFTDMNSLSLFDTLAVREASSISLTFQNMNMTGRNYYGIPCIYESSTSGVSVTYRNITYTGPQLVYNPMGLTHFEGCNITILQPNAQEVGEVCRVEFAGKNTISHTTSDATKAVFWFRGEVIGTAHFHVLSGAEVAINTTNYFMYNLVPATFPVTQNPVTYEVQPGASFTLTSHRGISYNTSHRAASFLVDTSASFRYIQETANGTAASLYVNGSLTVNEGANVYMQADFASAQPLINFATGTNIPLNINNPKSLVLYNRANAPVVLSASMSRNFTIRGGQLNHWTTPMSFPDAGSFKDIPQNKWINPDLSIFTVNGSVTPTQTTASSSTLKGPQPPLENFQFQSARVISVGNLPITPDPVIDSGRPITGLTEPGAKLIVTYNIGSKDYSFNITASENGRFEVDPEMLITAGTIVTIKANLPFLIATIETPVLPTGVITIQSAPNRIAFRTPPISTNPILLSRHDPEKPVVVYDSRPYPTQWELLASIAGPLETASGEVLEKAVVFKDDSGTLRELSNEPVVVHMGGPSTGQTDVFWPEEKGILVRVTEPIRSGVEYSTELRWELQII